MKPARNRSASPRAHAAGMPDHDPGGPMPRTSPALITAAMVFFMFLVTLDAPAF